MDSKIIVRILIVGLTTVLSLTIFTKKDFLKEDCQAGHTRNNLSING